MAAFGTGVATGKLHEMIDINMATDWEKVSIHKFSNHPELEQENNETETDTHQESGQDVILSEKTFDKESTTEDPGDNKPKLDSQDREKIVPGSVEQKTIEVVYGADGMDTIHPAPKELTEQTLDSGSNETENGPNEMENESKDNTCTNIKLSQDIVDEFEKHVQTKRTSKSESQPIHLGQPSSLGSDNTTVIPNEERNSRTSVTMATYTNTKPANQVTDRQTPGAKAKYRSGPPSRQTTSSSASAGGDSQCEYNLGKPDSGYSRRRQRPRQEDTKSNYSRYREDSRDEATGGQIEQRNDEFYKKNEGYLNDRFQSPRQPYEEGTQKTLLELMTRGLGNFTEQMANVMIEKIRPEYETLSRQVAKEVQEATMYELKELREKITNAQKALKDLEKEKDHLKKLLDNEKNKRVKEAEEKDAKIKKLEKDLEQCKTSLKDRDRVVKKADHRAKAEEQKRVQLEQEYQEQCITLKRHLDRAKGDLLVYRSQKRVALTMEKQEPMTLRNRLDSHH